MKFEDVKVGMFVKANSVIGDIGDGYVVPNDYGVIIDANNKIALVEWATPFHSNYGYEWWIDVDDIEPAYRKSEVVGNYIRVLRDDDDDFTIGETLKITTTIFDEVVISHNTGNYPEWYNNLPEIFTQSDLKNLYDGTVDFEYVLAEDIKKSKPQTKTAPKVKAKEIVVPITVKITNKEEIEQLIAKIDDKPIVEDSDDETIIYVGRHTIIFDKNFGTFGISSCRPNELDRYDRFIGRAVAYYKMNGGK